MSILSSQLVTTGTIDAPTSIIYISTSDTLSTILTAGYLSKYLGNQTTQLGLNQLAVVQSTDSGTVMLQVTESAGVWSLSNTAISDVVATPTVANQIAYATDTAGSLAASGLSTALFNAGNISAGKSGTAGVLESFPATATEGKLIIAAVANAGNFTTTISSISTLGQNEVMTIPDVGAATGQFLVKTAALVNGNFPKNSGTAGLVVDSGLAVANIMALNTVNTMAAASQIILDKGTGIESSNAVTINKMSGVISSTSLSTASLGTEVITLTNSEIATTSVFLATVQGGTNTTPGVIVSAVVTLHTAVITLTNSSLSALNGTVIIGFVVF